MTTVKANLTNPLVAGRRALALLETISSSPAGRTFSELAGQMALSDATLSRLLRMLVDEKWIRTDGPRGRYVVAYRALAFAHGLRGFGMQSPLVQGEVTTLAHNTGHSACVASFQGDYFTLVAKFEMLGSYHFIDLFLPNTDWIENGMGQCLLAFQSEDTVERIYNRVFDMAVPEAQRAKLAQIRQARSYVSREGDVVRVMAAIDDPFDSITNSVISVTALGRKMMDEGEIVRQVRHAASEVKKRLALSGQQLGAEV